jgi:hypothetical protein
MDMHVEGEHPLSVGAGHGGGNTHGMKTDTSKAGVPQLAGR